jgi:SAM-dependent methyltransferase
MSTKAIYDTIGQGYARQRRADPRIAARLTAALGGARSVLNVGAGSGSYEPTDRKVVALEPSAVMIAQRARNAAPAVQARAEALPFSDRAFDAVMGVLTLHHWVDRARGLAECARVARQRVVLLTFDAFADAFWLTRDYLPTFAEADRRAFPPMSAYTDAFGAGARVEIVPIPVPRECADGFLGAYWARPEAYLHRAVQAGMSSFARPGAEEGLNRLRDDLQSGAWNARYGQLVANDELDIGYRLVVAHLSPRAD